MLLLGEEETRTAAAAGEEEDAAAGGVSAPLLSPGPTVGAAPLACRRGGSCPVGDWPGRS